MTSRRTILRRYTDLPAVLHLLHERQITLLDPTTWDDTNDSHYLNIYKQKRNLATVLALCFTQAPETYHHWRIFAPGSSGVCVCFKRTILLSSVKNQPGLSHRDVRYLKMSEMREKTAKIAELTFLKRYAFHPEEEFRFVYESTTNSHRSLGLTIPLRCMSC